MDKGLTNIAGVLALADESWVNGGFEAVVCEIKEIRKKDNSGSFWKVTLNDGPGTPTCSMTSFGAPKYQVGDIIRVSGQGIKKGSYNGAPQVGLGKTTGVSVVSHGQAAQPAAPTATANQPAAQTAPAASASQPAAQSAPAASQLVNGQTVGMSINNAVYLYAELRKMGLTCAQAWEEMRSATFRSFMFEAGSMFIRESRALESGKLAPLPAKAADAPPPPPAKAQDNDSDNPPF